MSGKALIAVIKILKARFPNLTTEETAALAVAILDAIEEATKE